MKLDKKLEEIFNIIHLKDFDGKHVWGKPEWVVISRKWQVEQLKSLFSEMLDEIIPERIDPTRVSKKLQTGQGAVEHFNRVYGFNSCLSEIKEARKDIGI